MKYFKFSLFSTEFYFLPIIIVSSLLWFAWCICHMDIKASLFFSILMPPTATLLEDSKLYPCPYICTSHRQQGKFICQHFDAPTARLLEHSKFYPCPYICTSHRQQGKFICQHFDAPTTRLLGDSKSYPCPCICMSHI